MYDLKNGQKVALTATLVTIVLASAKGVVGTLACSSALIADAVHSGADILAIFASWLGLTLAKKGPVKKFPYGLYKVETLAALFVSGIIIYLAIVLFLEGWEKFYVVPHIEMPLFAFAVVVFSAVISLILASWEIKVGREINSQSLIANGDECKADFIASIVVFFAILCSHYEIKYVESILTILLSIFVFWIGAKNGYVSLLGLLDISPDIQMERKIRELILSIPEAKGVDNIKLRKAGPVLFGGANLKLSKSIDINRGHDISHKVIHRIKTEFKNIEHFSLHVEPYIPDSLTIMVPLDTNSEINSKISKHFGRAKYFAFILLNKNKTDLITIEENHSCKEPIRVSLGVVNEFVQKKCPDILITKEVGEIGFHVLRDINVDIYHTNDKSLKQAIDNFVSGKLEKIDMPTHKCENKNISH